MPTSYMQLLCHKTQRSFFSRLLPLSGRGPSPQIPRIIIYVSGDCIGIKETTGNDGTRLCPNSEPQSTSACQVVDYILSRNFRPLPESTIMHLESGKDE